MFFAFYLLNMPNDKGKPSSLYFKWTQQNRFNTSHTCTYDRERQRVRKTEREREWHDDKARWFSILKKFCDHMKIAQNKILVNKKIYMILEWL